MLGIYSYNGGMTETTNTPPPQTDLAALTAYLTSRHKTNERYNAATYMAEYASADHNFTLDPAAMAEILECQAHMMNSCFMYYMLRGNKYDLPMVFRAQKQCREAIRLIHSLKTKTTPKSTT